MPVGVVEKLQIYVIDDAHHLIKGDVPGSSILEERLP